MSVLKHSKHLNVLGSDTAPILVVCDVPSDAAFERGDTLPEGHMRKFREKAHAVGLEDEDFVFVTPAPPMDSRQAASDTRAAEHLAAHRDEFNKLVSKLKAIKLVIFLGKYAGQQVMGRSVKITKARGKITEVEGWGSVLGLFSLAHCFARPEAMELFSTDLKLAGSLKKARWSFKKYQQSFKMGEYEWCLDLGPLVRKPPPLLYTDTETRHLDWKRKPGILTLQMSWEEGQGIMVPWDRQYFPDLTEKQRLKNLEHAKRLFASGVPVLGHHLKYDLHMLENDGIIVDNWSDDTLQMAFAADENMEDKAQAQCVRRWVASMAGYSDEFDRRTDKSKMWLVPHDDMLKYGCGDTDSGLRLARVLHKLLKEDPRNYECYRRVQMPALRMYQRIERVGIKMDRDKLRKLGEFLSNKERELYDELIEMVPAKIKRAQLEQGKDLKFSRGEFVREILFGKDGIRDDHSRRLKPVAWTDSTKHEEEEEDREASLNGKFHLPLFEENCEFVRKYLDYSKVQKMRGTYVGTEQHEVLHEIRVTKAGVPTKSVATALEAAGVPWEEINKRTRNPLSVPLPGREDAYIKRTRHGARLAEVVPASGFFKHMTEDDCIFPSYWLSRAVTGRTSTSDPSFQNLPKHNEYAPMYRECIVARPGWVLIECDLSQIELRVAACEAVDETMIRIFNAAKMDIHSATAALTMGIHDAEFARLEEKLRKHKRFLAKAVNFGLIYGQWPEGLMNYARTQYKIKITLAEATAFRKAFFARYARLEPWHKAREAFVRKHGYARALHGALRRLPSVRSHNESMVRAAVRQGINSTVQRFGSDLCVMALTAFGNDCDWDRMRPLGSIHDAAVLEARPKYAKEAATAMLWYMEHVPLEQWFGLRLPVPIIGEASIGPNLDDMTEQKGMKGVHPRWARYYNE